MNVAELTEQVARRIFDVTYEWVSPELREHMWGQRAYREASERAARAVVPDYCYMCGTTDNVRVGFYHQCDDCRDLGKGDPAVDPVARVEQLEEEVRRLREALEHVRGIGHNLDCMFCGWKDLAVTKALAAPQTAQEYDVPDGNICRGDRLSNSLTDTGETQCADCGEFVPVADDLERGSLPPHPRRPCPHCDFGVGPCLHRSAPQTAREETHE